MNILISFPSALEQKIVYYLWANGNFSANPDGTYTYKTLRLYPVITGVGMMRTSYKLKQALDQHSPIDIALQVGVAGATKSMTIGTAMTIEQEEMIDGIWEEGMLKTDFDLGLESPDSPPFVSGKLLSELPSIYWKDMPRASSISTSTLTDDSQWCEARLEMAEAQLENMEGAAFYYVTNSECVPSIQIRGISNHVGIRDKSTWKIDEALSNANQLLIQLLDNIQNHAS